MTRTRRGSPTARRHERSSPPLAPRPEHRQQVRQGPRTADRTIEDLVERMRRTVQEAEETEPLMAKSLSDTFARRTSTRSARRSRTPEAGRRGLRRGGLQVISPRRVRGIDQLRRGRRAHCRSVLGDETATGAATGQDESTTCQPINRRDRPRAGHAAENEQTGRPRATAPGDTPARPGQPRRDGQDRNKEQNRESNRPAPVRAKGQGRAGTGPGEQGARAKQGEAAGKQGEGEAKAKARISRDSQARGQAAAGLRGSRPPGRGARRSPGGFPRGRRRRPSGRASIG